MKKITIAGLLLISSAVVVNTAFALLGTTFDYPEILQRPAAEVLARFGANPVVIGAGFAVLAAGAAMMAPIAVRISRQLPSGRVGTVAAVVGVAAAIVQVIGLLRWPLVVPFLATAMDGASIARQTDITAWFISLNAVLGQGIGETLGYLFTAAWTVLVAIALRQSRAIGLLLALLGFASAALILTGDLIPFGMPGADAANFIGYVLWSVWLVLLGITFIRRGIRSASAAPGTQPTPTLAS
ncbi:MULTISPECIES: DUF4386 family protein [unclassified Leifsonia]|uniref:DUF4386 family protein n=1 Tax=unclassified Leifsonia TaxID=2663824 RepID=UPI0007003421|nr:MULTISPECIES: DUF4386 family protein [unclassified Leifsonia]KQX05407.1 hypothetical protein ASC59_14850 [Leifsonia sp. Root1293]KRA09040.1 hypothetical protein ASD61_14845 [Leifsonia sp. Root60]